MSALRRVFGRQTRVSALAAGLLLLWVTVHILAAAPQFHHALHGDASAAQHHCVLTDIAGGSFEPPVGQAQCPQPDQPFIFLPKLRLQTPCCGVVPLAFASRAPPVLPSSSSQVGS